MSRAVIEGRDIGYFRFHTGGGTLLQPRPDTYREPFTASSINAATDEWTIGVHGFQTGDPIVFTMEATTETAVFDTTLDTVTVANHGFLDGEPVMFRTTGTMVDQVVAGRVYFIRDVTTSTFKLARKRFGQALNLTGSPAGTHRCAVLPSCLINPSGLTFYLDPNRTYYAIRSSSTTIKIAATKAEAVAGVGLNFITGVIGTVDLNDVRVHYDYRGGVSVIHNGFPFNCRKNPWGTPDSLDIHINDHNDHAPGTVAYWVQQPGSSSTVTFDLPQDLVQWTSHNLFPGDPVTFTTTGTLPTGLTPGVVYYVRTTSANAFTVAAHPAGGPSIDLSGSPTGTHTAFANGIYEVPHYYEEEDLFAVQHIQSNDVLTLTHPKRPVSELSRLGSTKWVLSEVAWNGQIRAPTGLEIVAFEGEGQGVSTVSNATPAILTTTSPHTFAIGETVFTRGVLDLPDQHYLVATTPAVNTLTLKVFDSGAPQGSTGGTPAASARIRPASFAFSWAETYVVTALNEAGEESAASTKTTVTNNLLTAGAQNTLTWEAVPNAKRYRIYKELDGILGFIGETNVDQTGNPTTFEDDHIGPDLSITPPILDLSLLRGNAVTFDFVQDTVTWANHDLEEGTPVIFDTNGTLPPEIVYLKTYFVVNPSDDTFQISETLGGSVHPFSTNGSSGAAHFARAGLWPTAAAYFEQRRVLGGPLLRPQDFWMTASGTESDLSYSIPTKDSDRIQNRLAAREFSQIRHAVPTGHLLLLTSSSEYRLTPLDSDALTPGSVSARSPTYIGTSTVAPVVVNNAVLFAVARGGHVREMGFADSVGDYVTGDVSLRASHFFDDKTIVQMTYQQAPQPIVWAVSSSGSLLGFSYIPEEQVAGWHEHDTGGVDEKFESCAAVSEGDEDRLYVIVNRAGSRFVERFGPHNIPDSVADCFYVDSGVSYSGPPVNTLFVSHLANRSVIFLADGVVGTGVVNALGLLALPSLASKVQVGLSYSSELRTLPLGMQVDAALGTGRTKNINRVWLRVVDSGAFNAGPSLSSLVTLPSTPPSGQLVTDLLSITVLGTWDEEGQVYVQQDGPLPLTVAGMTIEVATGG